MATDRRRRFFFAEGEGVPDLVDILTESRRQQYELGRSELFNRSPETGGKNQEAIKRVYIVVQKEAKGDCQREPANAQFRHQQKAWLGMAEAL